ncbi:MAG: adenine deaminase [Anaerolineae bacterium]|nr:adenine deaminase [Anaerolineae bacterium]
MLDFLIRNAQIVDVYRLRTFAGWVGVTGGRFAYVDEGEPPSGLSATQRLDAGGAFLAPGLIDAHMHIESSLTTPRRFAEAVLPFGTTAVLADPHEVANVAGVDGVRWMIAAARGLPLRVYIAIPSCVPATGPDIEWTEPVFGAAEVAALAGEEAVIALGEVMDYMGLLGQNDRLPGLVAAAREAGLLVEGHIPTLAGPELSRYLAHGITSDHTLTTPEKLREQVSKGVAVMLQAKSITAENIAAVNVLADRAAILLVTDDIEPPLLQHGHLSTILASAIQAGMPPLEAWASATVRPARYLGLRDLGGIAPGRRADFLLLERLDAFPPRAVYAAGAIVAREGAFTAGPLPELPPLPAYPGVPGPLQPDDFCLDPTGAASAIVANAVTLDNDRITLTRLEKLPLALQDGHPVFAPGDALDLAAVLARDGSSRAVGVVKNVHLERGAFASSLAHDSHNLLVIGRDPVSLAAAANAVHAMQGGVAVTQGEEVAAALPLPLYGLLSDQPVGELARDLAAVEDALRAVGMRHQRPFLMLSILALSVSPFYKFTDRGVVDTEARALLPAWVLPAWEEARA